jgi:CHAT domain-containing protein
MRENGGWENYSMIEIEKYPCRDDNEARAKEREWFEILNSGLNTQHPNRSVQEHYKSNRDNIAIQKRQYYEDHRAEIAIQKRQYYEDHRAEIAIQKRQYYEDHRAEIAIQKRQYNSNHKEEIETKNKQTFTCECGRVGTWIMRSRHLKSKFHKQYIESIILAPIPDMTTDDETATQLTRGICYIPLDQGEFENTKQHKEINDDHLYFSNHYDYMYQQ